MIRKLSVLFGVLFLSLWLSSTTSARDVRVTRTERICSTHPRPGYCDGPPGADEPTTTESVPEVPAVPLQLQLSDQPGAPQVGDVEIAIEDGATSATRTLFLSATNASDEAASAEIVNVFADIEGVTVEVVTKPETELASTLENGSFVVVTVKASVDATQADQVADERTWSGHLFADADGILTRLAPLQVDFSPAASVRVIGAADGKLQLGTQTPAFEGTVEIEVGPRDIEDLTVSFDALRSPGNRTVELTPDPSAPDLSTPQKVTARQRIKLPLTAELAEVGNYVGSMSVFAGSHVLATVDVTITRTRGAPDVDVEATVRTRHLSTGQRVDFLRGDKFATFSIEVENLTGAPLELAKPSLVNLARADGENLESESNDDHIRVYLQDPQDPDKRTLVGGAVEIPGDAISTFVFTVEGVDRAGTYTGTVKVRQVGGDSKDSVITILTRRPRWWLGGLVLVGTLVSLLTKWWVRNQRTKLAAQGQLLLLKTEFLRMRGDLKIDGAVNSVIARLQADLVTLGQISGDDPAKITAESVVFNQRLIVTPQWARLHYRLTSLDAEVHPVPNLADIRRQADEIRDRLKDHSTPLDSLKNDLSTLLPSLNRQLDDALLTRVGSLIDHLGELVVRDADPSTSVELTTAGRMEIERAKAELANAKKSLESKDLAAATSAYEHARERYVSTTLDSLEAWLATRPDWLPPGDWDKLRARLDQVMNPTAAQAASDLGAQTTDVIIDLLRAYVAALGDAIRWKYTVWTQHIASVSADDRAASGAYGRLKALHETVVPKMRADLDAGRYGDVRMALLAAIEQYNSIDDDPAAAAPVRAPSPDDDAAVRLPSMDLVPAAPPPIDAGLPVWTMPVVLSDLEQYRRRLRRLDGIMLLASVFVALLIANLLLYNDTWGTANDVISAILWGLGIQIGANYAFGGVLKLSEELQATPPAPAP